MRKDRGKSCAVRAIFFTNSSHQLFLSSLPLQYKKSAYCVCHFLWNQSITTPSLWSNGFSPLYRGSTLFFSKFLSFVFFIWQMEVYFFQSSKLHFDAIFGINQNSISTTRPSWDWQFAGFIILLLLTMPRQIYKNKAWRKVDAFCLCLADIAPFFKFLRPNGVTWQSISRHILLNIDSGLWTEVQINSHTGIWPLALLIRLDLFFFKSHHPSG